MNPASHVIPAGVCARAWNLWEAGQRRTLLERERQAEGREDGQLARNLAGDQVDVKHVVAVVDVGHAEVSLQ